MHELKVICNPFAGLDHEGVPAGVFPFDPDHGAGDRRWVGASIDRARSGPEKPVPGRQLPMMLVPTGAKSGRRTAAVPMVAHRHFFAFDLAPQRVPNIAHYRKGILHGDLFPADLATANDLGLKFTPPQAALAAARDKALADWRSAHGGEPDFRLWPQALRPGGAVASRSDGEADPKTPSTEAPDGAGSAS